MTIVDRNEPTPTPQTGMSPKAKQAIAVGSLLACLLVGAGIVYWLLFASSPKGKRSVQVDPAQQAPARPQMQMRTAQRRDVPGVWKQDSEWVVRSATGEMRVKAGSASAADVIFRFPDGLKLPPEQVALLAGRFRILHDDAMAAEWKVTPDQIAKLKALQVGGSNMTPSQARRDELWKLYQTFDKATGQAKVDEQKKLTDKLEETAKSLFEPARQQYAGKLDEMRKILTAEQVQLITKR
jgi:hypothetical protein